MYIYIYNKFYIVNCTNCNHFYDNNYNGNNNNYNYGNM